MKFVILSSKILPGYDVCGPILSPAEYDIHLILRWINFGIDVREYMEDGSFRKLKQNDPKLVELLNEKIEREARKREERKKLRIDHVGSIDSRANARLKPERLAKRNPAPKKVSKPKKIEPPKEEIKIELSHNEYNIKTIYNKFRLLCRRLVQKS